MTDLFKKLISSEPPSDPLPKPDDECKFTDIINDDNDNNDIINDEYHKLLKEKMDTQSESTDSDMPDLISQDSSHYPQKLDVIIHNKCRNIVSEIANRSFDHICYDIEDNFSSYISDEKIDGFVNDIVDIITDKVKEKLTVRIDETFNKNSNKSTAKYGSVETNIGEKPNESYLCPTNTLFSNFNQF